MFGMANYFLTFKDLKSHFFVLQTLFFCFEELQKRKKEFLYLKVFFFFFVGNVIKNYFKKILSVMMLEKKFQDMVKFCKLFLIFYTYY